MAVFSIKSFGGIAPVVPARYLADNQAQTAINCPVFQGSIQAIADLGASVADLPKTGTIKSLYRFFLPRDLPDSISIKSLLFCMSELRPQDSGPPAAIENLVARSPGGHIKTNHPHSIFTLRLSLCLFFSRVKIRAKFLRLDPWLDSQCS